ncbi:putative protein 56 [Bacillus phage Nf]|uniref:Uncharacterized protein n=1 Tax=Bacillus phage Nf TaxID=2992639 RepID=B7SSL9_BPNF|nr:putative protein 56 [Bacillus phage Nf]ACH57066.1 putative protein 56 [Bacillus phage Nf]
MIQNDFIDSYTLSWLLRDDDGCEHWEVHEGLSLSDFEVVYGNNPHQIVKLNLVKEI